MPNLEWIHCNLCYYNFEKRQRKIYHLTCFHLLCRNCMAKTDGGKKCPVCKRSINSYMEVGKAMQPRLKELYEPAAPITLLDRAHQAINFQLMQKQHMIDRIIFCRSQLQKMDEAEQTLKMKVLESQRRYEKLRNYRRTLQESLRRMQTSELFEPKSKPLQDSELTVPATYGTDTVSLMQPRFKHQRTSTPRDTPGDSRKTSKSKPTPSY